MKHSNVTEKRNTILPFFNPNYKTIHLIFIAEFVTVWIEGDASELYEDIVLFNVLYSIKAKSIVATSEQQTH